MPDHKWTKFSLIIFTLCGHVLLVSCGTKGPLYIPEQRYPQKVEQPAQQDKTTQPTKE